MSLLNLSVRLSFFQKQVLTPERIEIENLAENRNSYNFVHKRFKMFFY